MFAPPELVSDSPCIRVEVKPEVERRTDAGATLDTAAPAVNLREKPQPFLLRGRIQLADVVRPPGSALVHPTDGNRGRDGRQRRRAAARGTDRCSVGEMSPKKSTPPLPAGSGKSTGLVGANAQG